MASRGYLPGQKVAGEWRFVSAEINYWIETQLPGYTEEELAKLEGGAGLDVDRQPLISALMSDQTMAVPLNAGTRSSLLRALVGLAEQSWQVYDVDALHAAVKEREDMASTGTESGVAIPHPHRPLPRALGEDVIAYGRTTQPVPFGGAGSGACDVFFLVCCREHRTHLQVLARLARLLLRPGFTDQLRAAETTQETLRVIESAERALLEE
jgi:PTS system nitrogen regulatory IIA component